MLVYELRNRGLGSEARISDSPQERCGLLNRHTSVLQSSGRVPVLAGEKRGWKLRRIAAPGRRPWKVLARARIRLDHLAIKMPGRMPEHRHHHGQAEEQRQ